MTHQLRRYHVPTSVSLKGTNVQQDVSGISAILEPGLVASSVDMLKPIGIREVASASFAKRESQFWTHRFQINEQRRLFPFRVDHLWRTNLMTYFESSASKVCPLKCWQAGVSFHSISSTRITSSE